MGGTTSGDITEGHTVIMVSITVKAEYWPIIKLIFYEGCDLYSNPHGLKKKKITILKHIYRCKILQSRKVYFTFFVKHIFF